MQMSIDNKFYIVHIALQKCRKLQVQNRKKRKHQFHMVYA